MSAHEPEMSIRDNAPSITSQHGLAAYPASLAAQSDRGSGHGTTNDDPFADPAVAGGAAAGAGAGTAAAATAEGAEGAPAAAPAEEKKKFYKKPAFILILIVNLILGLVLLFVLLYPLVHGIADRLLNVVNMGIESAVIRNPSNTTFDIALGGKIFNTGGINAKLTFHEPVAIYWVQGHTSTLNETETLLGHTTLTPVYSRGGRATLDQHSTFTIANETAFGDFTAYMINTEKFTWRLKSEVIQANALKFPVVNGLSLSRDVEVPGINSFLNNILLTDFQLPGDAPNGGGINFVATTRLTNPSPFDIQLGNVAFDLSYESVYLGRGYGHGVSIAAMGPTDVTLNGTLVPHNNDTFALGILSKLFSAYISDESSPVSAVGVYTQQTNGEYISWLSAGIAALNLTVPLKPPTPINPIKTIDIGYLNLSFTEGTEWGPLTNSDNITAELGLPFGFQVNISNITNSFTIYQNGTGLAGLSTPVGAASSDIHTYASNNISGPVFISIDNSSLGVIQESHDAFEQFTRGLTVNTESVFQLIGSSGAVTELSIGTLYLNPIKFNVTSSLTGLNSLNTQPTTINSVDVVGGTPDHISLNISVTIFNPANLNLGVGDLFLELFNDGSPIGTTLLPDLLLLEGTNTLQVTSNFTPNANAAGLATLNQFVSGTPTALTISGYENSTDIESLLLAFESLAINTTLPGLTTKLLNTSSLTVLSTTGYANNLSHVSVNIDNPFTASLNILSVAANVSAYGITLGQIATGTNFVTNGKAITTSPELDINQNLEPEDLFTVLRVLLVESGQNTQQLDGIMALGGYQYVTAVNTTDGNATIPTNTSLTTSGLIEERSLRRHVNRLANLFERNLPSFIHSSEEEEEREESNGLVKRDNIYTNFNLPTYVDTAFKLLKADIDLVTEINIGGYDTTLTYKQLQVPVQTDQTLNYLLPVLARPIVQKIVNASILGFNTILITDAEENSFNTVISGSITDAGPFDAVISFPAGLTVAWNGSPLGKIAMPNVTLVGDVGANLNLTAAFSVSDTNALASFTQTLLTNDTFTWNIYGEDLSINAIGIDVGLVTINKTVTLKGFNGLKNNDVIINSFDLPANDPAGGIHLTLNTSVTNPSQVGIALTNISFNANYHTTFVGPVAASNAFTLTPLATIQLPLAGRLVPQSDAQGLTDMGTIFTNYVHGVATNLTVVGDTADGANGPSWLESGIKFLSIGVLLPAPQNLQVIEAITLSDLELNFTTDTDWAPSAGTRSTLAKFTLPFAFPIDVTGLQSSIAVNYAGDDVAVLPIGQIATTTNVSERIIHLAFDDVPFDVYSNKHDQFAAFLKSTTVSTNQTFGLSGAANTTADLAIGTVVIQNIAFDVQTSLAGLQGLTAKPTNVSDLDVNHGYPDYLLIKVNTALYNPSMISIGTGTVSFALELQNEQLGVAIIDDAYIIPGTGMYSTNVQYQPSGDAANAVGRILLQNYISGIDTTTTIQGTSQTTDIDSLAPALEAITLSAIIPAINATLITQTNIEFPGNVAQTRLASATFILANPFTASINLNTIYANATYNTNGSVLDVAYISDVLSSPITADGHTNITSTSIQLVFNTDPVTIIKLLEAQAALNKVDLGPLPALFEIVLNDPDFTSSIISQADNSTSSKCSSGTQFAVDDAILNSLKGLIIDLNITSSLHLDDYGVTLSFTQNQVPAITDDTALNLIGAVAPPIVQYLVDNATLAFSQANISNIAETGFDLSLLGSLTGTGPLDAYITFPEPLTVTFQGYNIAQISLPPICAAANAGVPTLTTSATLKITDENGFASFATYLLHNPEFTWTISGNNVTVSALGFDFLNVKLSKDVSFKGLNNLPGVTIADFQLPGDDSIPGLDYSVNASIPSPSNLGLTLGTVAFQAYYSGVDLGPIAGSNFALAPLSTTIEPLNGHILQPSSGNENTVGELFSDYISGVNATLQVTGDYVSPDGKDEVQWLSTAFKTLTIDVVLPGIKETLVTSARIEFPADVDTNGGITQTEFTLNNPFGATIRLQSLVANATHSGLYLGIINVSKLDPVFVADGYTSTTSSYYPLEFDIDPVHIIQVVNQLAKETNTDLGPLPELFALVLANPTYHPNITATPTNSSDGCSSGKQFDVDGAILDVLKGLTVDLDVQSTVELDDITVPLHFTQTNVTAITDDTALNLIPVVAPPIVQLLVNNATLSFSSANISNITNDGFDLVLKGSLTGTGPLDALITFVDPVTVVWEGNNIAEITLPDLCADAYTGIPDLETNAHLTLTDESQFEKFAEYLLHNQNFTWTITSSTVRVTALNIIFDHVALSKDVSFAGFNGLPGVTIADFQLPGDDSTPGLLYSVDSSIPSPSNLGIQLGTVAFQAYYSGVDLGPISGNNLLLAPDAITMEPLSGHILQPSSGNEATVGELFSEYISGVNTTLQVKGDYVAPDGTDKVTWLSDAFESLTLSVVLPGIKETLVTQARIEFPTDIATNGGIASADFTLHNPFGVTIRLESIIANATHSGLYLGVIDVNQLNPVFVADGNTNTTSSYYPLEFDIDPIHIIQVVNLLATETKTDLGPLPELFEIVIANPNYHPNITATPNNSSDGCSSGKQFDVDGAILNVLKGLTVDLDVQSTVQLDDITVPLHFNQSDVPAITDDTALYLITVVAPPIVQTLVNNATLAFSSANISNVNNDGFDLTLKGQLLDTGPLDALITFVDPVTVIWEGNDIAEITLPPLCAAANSGIPDLETSAHLTITDQGGFTTFAEFLLHNANFTWTIKSNTVRVTALNIVFDGVELSKDVSFLGFNNLPGVTISNFNLPSDDPAGGITISTDSLIPSLSNLGIELGDVGFVAYYQNVELGPLTADNLDLLPESTTTAHLGGRLIPQSSSSDLAIVGDLFSRFLAGDNTTLQVKGDYADGAQSSQVTWLSTALKTLTLDVILPGHIYQIIFSITIEDLELVMTDASEAYAPPASTKDTVATFKNPFGFSLTPIETAANITLSTQGVDIATLAVPNQQVNSETSTGNLASLTLTFDDVPLRAVNDQAFAATLAAVTDTQGIDPELEGTVNIVANTKIGDVPIGGIPFNVTSAIAGIEGFNGKLGISNVSITGSGGNGAYITSDLTATLDNPSNLSLTTNDVSLETYYKDILVGYSVVPTFPLVPGTANYAAEFHYQPANANDTVAQTLLQDYLQYTDPIDLTVKGYGDSSPYSSLVPALEGLSLSGSFNGIGARLVTHINAYITATTLLDNYIEIDFDAYNPLDTDIQILFAQNDASVDGKIYAHFDYAFPSFKVPAKGSANSGRVPKVLLVNGALLSLGIIPLMRLDIANALTIQVDGGYTIPWLQYEETDIPTTYSIDLLGIISDIPSIILSIIGEATSLAGAATQSTASVASALSILSELSLSSIAGAITSDVGSVTSVVGSITSDVGSITSDIGSIISSDVGGLTSTLLNGPKSPATSPTSTLAPKTSTTPASSPTSPPATSPPASSPTASP